jgi:predicted nuclease of restriction endonuclease-like (RecB) superfamily
MDPLKRPKPSKSSRSSKPTDIQWSDDYKRVLEDLKERVAKAQLAALKAVNRELIGLYFDIGRIVVEKQEEFGWGESMAVIDQLAHDLQAAFPGMRGFSTRNLRYMRSFYLTYKDQLDLQALLANLSWTHHMEILVCKSVEEQEFYLKMAAKYGWSYRVLGHQIASKAYERWLLNQTNFDATLVAQSDKYRGQAKLAVRDDYNFDFLEMTEPHLEREFEEALVSRMAQFLGELGGYFTFVGRQYRLEVDDSEFFIDLRAPCNL